MVSAFTKTHNPTNDVWAKQHLVSSDTRKKPICRTCGSAMKGHPRGPCKREKCILKVEPGAPNVSPNTQPTSVDGSVSAPLMGKRKILSSDVHPPVPTSFHIPVNGHRVNPYLCQPAAPRSLSRHDSWVPTSIMDSQCHDRVHLRTRSYSSASQTRTESEPGLDATTHHWTKAKRDVQNRHGMDLVSVSGYPSFELANQANEDYRTRSIPSMIFQPNIPTRGSPNFSTLSGNPFWVITYRHSEDVNLFLNGLHVFHQEGATLNVTQQTVVALPNAPGITPATESAVAAVSTQQTISVATVPTAPFLGSTNFSNLVRVAILLALGACIGRQLR